MDVHTAEQRRGNMAAIKSKHTKPEMLVRRMLHAAGYRYFLHGKALPGKPDLVFPSRKKAIFVHGCFWHRHSCRYGSVVPKTRAEFWQKKREANSARDVRNQTALVQQGWTVMVVWECETKDKSGLLSRLGAFLDGQTAI